MSRILIITLLLTFLFGARPQVRGSTATPGPYTEALPNGTPSYTPRDVYLVFYATADGRTGHVGIAIDKYRVRVLDCAACPGGVRYDTARTGELVYFDLWPEEERQNYNFFFGEVTPRYYCLPASSAEPPITVRSLMTRALPHAMKAPPDGLARLATTPDQDAALTDQLQTVVEAARPFSLYEFNCSDFAALALNQLLPSPLYAEELVLFRLATTPNRLWRALVHRPETTVLKDPGVNATGSFNAERIFTFPYPYSHEN